MRSSVIVFDLDGTACDSSSRNHDIISKDWDAFHAGIEDYPEHPEVVDMLHAMRKCGKTLVCCTARDEKFALQTRAWLRRRGLECVPLLMRPTGNDMPSAQLKPMLLMNWLRETFSSWSNFPEEAVQVILEDRDAVVQAWRDLGFNCWQVRKGQY